MQTGKVIENANIRASSGIGLPSQSQLAALLSEHRQEPQGFAAKIETWNRLCQSSGLVSEAGEGTGLRWPCNKCCRLVQMSAFALQLRCSSMILVLLLLQRRSRCCSKGPKGTLTRLESVNSAAKVRPDHAWQHKHERRQVPLLRPIADGYCYQCLMSSRAVLSSKQT